MMKKNVLWVSIFSMLWALCVSSVTWAQDGTPSGGGYGQALGTRSSQARPLQLNQGPNSFSNDSNMQDSDMANKMKAYRGGGRGGGMDGSLYQIHILGLVASPGTYRLPPSIRMAEAIELAGGATDKGSMRRVELRRGGHTRTYDLTSFLSSGNLNQNPFLMDNDVVYIPYTTQVVSIMGPVKRTGIMELVTEKNLLDLVRSAGGYTAGVLRSEPITVVRYVDGKKTILRVEMVDEAMMDFSIFNGDVIIVPHVMSAGRKFDYNISELPNDNIFFPSFMDKIFVMGAVSQPGAYQFNVFTDIRQYINMAGPVRYAALKRIKVLDLNGKPVDVRNIREYKLNPGDTIVVPYKAFTTDNVLKWYNTLSSSVFTGFALQQLIKNN